jgi:hypothetical protein
MPEPECDQAANPLRKWVSASESPAGSARDRRGRPYGAEHDHLSALVVRGGVFGQRLELIPIETVDSVEPRRKLLTLDHSRRDP